jgi:hypothetical protein
MNIKDNVYKFNADIKSFIKQHNKTKLILFPAIIEILVREKMNNWL